MKIAGIYSFKNGKEVMESQFLAELEEVKQVIASIDSAKHKTKISKEKTMPGRMLYKPGSLNKTFRREFEALDWHKHKIYCEYPTQYYTSVYNVPNQVDGAYREMDFVKNRIGIEVQFGKYAFMVYNVRGKMAIFHNQGIIDVGVEIVPVKDFAREMSTGVSFFEQFVWDLEHIGVTCNDVPVLILGVTA